MKGFLAPEASLIPDSNGTKSTLIKKAKLKQ
jgi:hypothetical protein